MDLGANRPRIGAPSIPLYSFPVAAEIHTTNLVPNAAAIYSLTIWRPEVQQGPRSLQSSRGDPSPVSVSCWWFQAFLACGCPPLVAASSVSARLSPPVSV